MKRKDYNQLTEQQKKYRKVLQQRLRRKKNPNKEAEYNARAAEYKKQWAKDNKDRLKQRNAELYQENREYRLECAKSYRDDNPEKIKEYRRARYKGNKEAILARNKKWRNAQSRDDLNAYTREWRANNRAKVKEYGHKRGEIQKNSLKLLDVIHLPRCRRTNPSKSRQLPSHLATKD